MPNGPRIDDEIRRLCRALTTEERNELRASLEAEGLRESLIVWQAANILLDGHHRLELCGELGITPRFKPAPDIVCDRLSAIAWVHRCQLGRRNLNPEELAYHRGKLYEAEKQSHGGDRRSPNGSSVQNEHLKSETAADRVAAEFGVSAMTIRRDAAFASAVDSIERNVGPEIAQSIRAGTSQLSKSQVTEIGAMDAASQPIAVAKAQVPKRNENIGARLALADGLNPEQAYQKVAALEASGASHEDAVKAVGMGRQSYDAIRRIMLLAERDDLPEKDKATVCRARETLNREHRVRGPAELVAPIAERLWGVRRGAHSHDEAERSRQRKFDKAVHVMIHACLVARDIEIPHLGPDRSKEVIAELDEAIGSIRAFRRKVKELSQ